MQVKKLIELKNHYAFEAPLFKADVRPRKNGESAEFENTLDLNEFLAPNPKSVYLARVTGDSMIDKRIYQGDILVVDTRQEPRDGSVVVASLDGETAVKSLRFVEDKTYLYAANERFRPIEITEEMRFQILGVVKHVISAV